MSKKPQSRREIALIVSFCLGLIIGLFIKKVSIGLLIGIVLGVLIGGMWIGKGDPGTDRREDN